MRRFFPLVFVLFAAACGPSSTKKSTTPYVIEIDIDDHGLKALWQANAPNLKKMIHEGTLAYSRTALPTHSNHNNMALITGNYPDGHDVAANGPLDRQNYAHDFAPDIDFPGLPVGDYCEYPDNPLNPAAKHHVDNVWTTAAAAKLPTTYVGQFPIWDIGADVSHLALLNESLMGIQADAQTVDGVVSGIFKYPQPYIDQHFILDGPGDTPATIDHSTTMQGPWTTKATYAGSADETTEHFTIRDAAEVWKAAAAGQKPPRYMFVWDFLALDGDPTSEYGADGTQVAKVVADYDDAVGDLLKAIAQSPEAGQVNIMFTLDQGKVDTTKQAALGTYPDDANGGQLYQLVKTEGAAHGVGPTDYRLVNEDGDALIYAYVKDAGTARGAEAQEKIVHGLVDMIQEGSMQGVDISRTMTWDGYDHTRRFHDYRIEASHQADIIVFPKDGWTLNSVDKTSEPGPFDTTIHPYPYGRHGGLSVDELYVPLILWGPAFKEGVYLPHPVNHPDVAPTAMKILGLTIPTAEGAPILAALKGDPGEALPQPSNLSSSTSDQLDALRDTILDDSGYGKPLPAPPSVQQVVIVDLAGVYADELMTDKKTMAAAPNLVALAKSGTAFENMWTRSRSWAETQYEILAGGAPVTDAAGAWVPEVDSDPAQTAPPGEGLLFEPHAPLGTPANPAALARWRSTDDFGGQSLLSAAAKVGIPAADIEETPSALAHFAADSAVTTETAASNGAAELKSFFSKNAKAVAYVGLGGKRTKDRDSAAALAELEALDADVHALQAVAPKALFIVTSRGATDVDDPGGDFYGPESSMHVPLIVAGPEVEKGRVTGEPAEPADIPATVFFALDWSTTTDFVEGTWASNGTYQAGETIPIPTGATGGHVLARAFEK